MKNEKISKSELAKIKEIRRRNGEVVSFELERIVRAVLKAFECSVSTNKIQGAVASSVFLFTNHLLIDG